MERIEPNVGRQNVASFAGNKDIADMDQAKKLCHGEAHKKEA